MNLEILYQDDYVVAVNKPHGLLVHRTRLDKDATEFALQMVRNQLNQRVSPIHRLDRKTSGILLFSLNAEVHKAISSQFEAHTIEKEYIALVRGYAPPEGLIDYDLTDNSGKVQKAITEYENVRELEIPVPSTSGQHPTSRYSILKVRPRTGRFHQIRKHLAHIMFPIIGDRPHGCNKQNKLFKERWGKMTMMLCATSLKFHHPVYNRDIHVQCSLSADFKSTLKLLNQMNVDRGSLF